MKLIDRYMLKGFLFSFLVVYVSMVGLTVMIDMVLNIDEFMAVAPAGKGISNTELLGHVGQYYFFRLFEYFQWLCGAAVLVGGAFAVARLNKHNELVAFTASGVSAYRLLLPVIAAGAVMSALYIVNGEFVIPNITDQLVTERSLAKAAKGLRVQYVRDSNNTLFYAPRYLPDEQAMVAEVVYAADGKTVLRREPVRIVLRDPETSRTEAIIDADRAVHVHQGDRQGWKLTGGTRWEVRIGETDETGAPMRARTQPADFVLSDMDPDTLLRQSAREYYRYLGYGQLHDLVRRTALVNPAEYEVVMHQHFSKPILNFIVLLLGLPLVVGREGKSYFISVVLCIGLFVGALATEHVASAFAGSGHLPPVLGAYLPVLVFAPIAVVSLDRMRT